jgi:hypothetical protein
MPLTCLQRKNLPDSNIKISSFIPKALLSQGVPLTANFPLPFV